MYNHEREGHHIHKGDREIPYKFVDEWRLIGDFQNDVEKITKGGLK